MDAVEEIKHRLAIEDVIGEYVQLKRAGRNFKGLSPFTSEKTASFMVSPEKQIWHDFSSGKGGNIFSFVMEMEGLDFKGALEMLARKAGVELEQYRSGSSKAREDQKKKLLEINELTAKFYQAHFAKNKTALDYIKKRGYQRQVVLDFRIGYSPNQGSALSQFLAKKGYKSEEIKAAGLAAQRGGQTTDMFRDRLMIPLMDAFGQVIGFTARILTEDPNAPKYINTPSTILYDKSRHIFGLHLAKEAIRKNEFAVMVEGNLDVVASHQAGVKNVVATAGTALTEYQLKSLSRLASEVRLAFDQDKAGQAATERAVPIASKIGVNLSVITIPSGKDPDELIKNDPKSWQAIINKSEYALDWLINYYKSQIDVTSVPGKKQFSDALLPILKQLQDPVEQNHYITTASRIMETSPEALVAKISSAANKVNLRKTPKTAPNIQSNTADLTKAQNQLLAVVFAEPKLREVLQPISIEMLKDEPAKKLLGYLKKNPSKILDENKLPAELKDISDYVKITSLQFEELYRDVEDQELAYEVRRLRARVTENYVKTAKTKLAETLKTSSDDETETLLKQVKRLDNLLKEVETTS